MCTIDKNFLPLERLRRRHQVQLLVAPSAPSAAVDRHRRSNIRALAASEKVRDLATSTRERGRGRGCARLIGVAPRSRNRSLARASLLTRHRS